MEAIILAVSPLAVSFVTSAIKKFGVFKVAGEYKKSVTRFGAVALSFGAVYLTASLNGVEIDPTSVETLSQAFVVFLGATGVYFFAK